MDLSNLDSRLVACSCSFESVAITNVLVTFFDVGVVIAELLLNLRHMGGLI